MKHFVQGLMLVLILTCVALGEQTAPGGVVFADATAEAGVDFLHWDQDPLDPLVDRPQPYFCAGAAAGDYDNDGWVDLFVTRVRAPNLLFRNLRDGTFEEVGAKAGVDLAAVSAGCVWGDVNNDGLLDLYVLAMFGRGYLYVNKGDGSFEECAVRRGVNVTDDLSDVTLTSAAFGDYDRDGDLDLLVLAWSPPSRNRLFKNNGNGFFDDVSNEVGLDTLEILGFSGGFADLDGDGWDELLVVGDFGTSHLFRYVPVLGFTDITTSSGVGTDRYGMGFSVGDIDNDGDLDLFVTSIFFEPPPPQPPEEELDLNGNRMYVNDGGATFEDLTDPSGVRDGGWGWGTAFFDFDNDGDLDLGMTNGLEVPFTVWGPTFHDDPLRLWQNDGGGDMTEVSSAVGFTDTSAGKGFVVFDFDRDGDLDVFISNTVGHPILLKNSGGNSAPWLRVSLRGRFTNYYGLGAKITVRTTDSDPAQFRQVNANSNYMSQNELVAHFGLGETTSTILDVSVQWPASGITTRLRNVPPNRLVVVHEVTMGDLDGDQAMTESDLSGWSTCLTGPAAESIDDSCVAVDFNGDGDVDLHDWQAFQVRMEKAKVTP